MLWQWATFRHDGGAFASRRFGLLLVEAGVVVILVIWCTALAGHSHMVYTLPCSWL